MVCVMAIVIGNAQVCKISETGDNVEVFGAVLSDNGEVTVTVGNDSEKTSANVTASVEVTYAGNGTKVYTFTGKAIAKPNATTEIKIRIPEKDNIGRTPKSVNVTGISGTKCRE